MYSKDYCLGYVTIEVTNPIIDTHSFTFNR